MSDSMTRDDVLSALGEISQHFENCAEATWGDSHERFDRWMNAADWAAAYLNDQAPTVNGWISADIYPDQAGRRYLLTVRNVHYGDVSVIIGHTGYGNTSWYTSDTIYMENYRAGDNRLSHNYVVTHWMQMPEPPEEVSGCDEP